MDLKKYIAPTMREALLKVKEDLGPSAVIIRTEQLPGGVLNEGQIEVTASLDESLVAQPEPNHFDHRLKETLDRIQKGDHPLDSDATSKRGRARESETAANPFQGTYTPRGQLFRDSESFPNEISERAPKPAESSDKLSVPKPSQAADIGHALREEKNETSPSQLQREMEKLQTQLKSLQGQISDGFQQMDSSVPPELKRMFKALQHEGLQGSLIGAMIAEYALEVRPTERTEDHLTEWMGKQLAAKLPVAPPIGLNKNRASVLLFLGPTGVGKSTTIAKIAAQQVLSQNLSVGIISTDAYRMGAMEQMAIFARSAEIDFRAAFNENDIDQSIEELSDKDLILVDSAGRSREHHAHMAELGEIARYVQADETYLVLAANTRERDMEVFYDRFKPFGVNRLILTKVDETSEMGALWNLAVKKHLPLSYLCHGQTIPDDILVADPNEIARWILVGA